MADVRMILEQVKRGQLSVEEAEKLLGTASASPDGLPFAHLDHEREERTGFPEVIFGEGKSSEQLLAIWGKLKERQEKILATRVKEEQGKALQRAFPEASYDQQARIAVWSREPLTPERPGYVAIVAAGTSDWAVAQEAAWTVRCMGSEARVIADVGVAGIHRLFRRLDEIREASVIICVAGMEGALTSVVTGLVDKPVIAVPTSVGYGASFGGVAALLTMLNSCATGAAVVNIDNGFGAGYMAGMIHRQMYPRG